MFRLRATLLVIFFVSLLINIEGKTVNDYQTKDVSFEQWLQSLRFCYDKRPQHDELARKLIKKFPQHNEQYFKTMFYVSIGSLFAKKKDKSIKELERFQNWYLDIVKQELEDQQVEELYRLVE